MCETIPESVRGAWSEFSNLTWCRVTSGLINTTFRLEDAAGIPKGIVQQLHSIFDSEVNIDIEAVTSHLSRKGLMSPRLIRTSSGDLWTEAGGRTWRALTYVPGDTFHKLAGTKMAYQAGELVGHFHSALSDLEHVYHSSRNVHVLALHLNRLISALDEKQGHALHGRVNAAAEILLAEAELLPKFDYLPLRHAHGDLKISNLLFDKDGKGNCLIDLDTLSLMAWPFEMGDALRSWCNARMEDERPAVLDLAFFDAALAGYAAENNWLSNEEIEVLVIGLIQICLELSARFFADALNEDYFAWDATRYASRGEHNLARAEAMWELYLSVQSQRNKAEQIVTSRLA